MQYPTLMARMELEDVTFVKYDDTRCGKKSFALSTSSSEEDMQFPIFAKGVSYVDVPADSVLHFHRPSLGKIDPSNCVDMPCDAKKESHHLRLGWQRGRRRPTR